MQIHAKVIGKVQGVGMRAFVRREALLLDLKGSVKNCEDGSVEIIAQGPKDRLQELLAKIQSRFAVDRIEVDYSLTIQTLFKDFE